MNFLLTLMNAMATGSIFYVADYVTQSSTLILLIYIFVPLGLGIPFANPMVQKLGLLRAQQIYLLVGGIGLVSLAFITVNLIPINLVIIGLGFSGQQTITYNILAYVIDDDEVRTGNRREGASYGANALLTKPAQGTACSLVSDSPDFGELWIYHPGDESRTNLFRPTPIRPFRDSAHCGVDPRFMYVDWLGYLVFLPHSGAAFEGNEGNHPSYAR